MPEQAVELAWASGGEPVVALLYLEQPSLGRR